MLSLVLITKPTHALARFVMGKSFFGMSNGSVQDFVTAIADQNQYNPVAIGFYQSNGIKTTINRFLGNN